MDTLEFKSITSYFDLTDDLIRDLMRLNVDTSDYQRHREWLIEKGLSWNLGVPTLPQWILHSREWSALASELQGALERHLVSRVLWSAREE